MLLAFLYHWFDWPQGSVLTNLIASVVWVPLTYMAMLRKLHCSQKGCIRIGTVPVPGTVHKVCKKHAKEQGHTH